nr:uncharacterized protein LOC109159945 [Ipomoea batatas]GMD70943.1 uncharacterized protein LOC109159945 [Ipomoea batatas]
MVFAELLERVGARSNNICRTWKAFNFGWTSVQHGSSNRSVHSFSMEDDSFAELGPPVTERAVSQLKLATEKPERFIKAIGLEEDLLGGFRDAASRDNAPSMFANYERLTFVTSMQSVLTNFLPPPSRAKVGGS